MIQREDVSQSTDAATGEAIRGDAYTLWGLTVREIHDAFWLSRGVQCVRRGSVQDLQRAAEMYLLIEPEQLVVFNIAELIERLTWHNAIVTRLRLVDEHEKAYSERVVINDRNMVERIERRYRPQLLGTSRVVLTTSRRVSRIWMAAATRRDGWDRVRRSVPWPRVDHWKRPGIACMEGDSAQEHEILDELVQRWPTPAQSIDGLNETEPGVWQMVGEPPSADTVRIGPMWLGRGRDEDDLRCLVGPRWMQDRNAAGGHVGTAASVRSIAQVELAEAPRPTVQTGPGATYALIKRAIDIMFSTAALLCLSPLMLLMAAFVLMESGSPLFFGHLRQGKGGRPFKCWKFRTMHPNAEQIARQLEAYNVCDGPQVYIQDDPRVTRVGRVLRKTHLDELPQFFNVLLGQMSLVGPRPSPDDENQYCPAWRDLRLSVRPGITGLWQLKRKREPGEDFQEWIKYDIEYVRNAGGLFDLLIVLRTAWMLVAGRPESEAD